MMHATLSDPLTVAFPSHACRITWDGGSRFTIFSACVEADAFTVYGITGPIEATAAMWHYLAQNEH